MPSSNVSLAVRAQAELELRRRRAAQVALHGHWRRDPLALASAAGFVADPWQVRALQSSAQTILLNCGRQVGKSTTTAMLIVRELLRDDAMVVIVCPSERQSKELLRKVLTFWRQLGRPIRHIAATRTSLELANGARLEAFPGSSDTIVGISAVTLLVADEAARITDTLYAAVSPMLAASNGRLVAPSTPKGKRGWWYQLWSTPLTDDPDIERISIPTSACPRVAATFLARERRRVGEYWYGQEYDCKFQDAQTAAFRSEDIEQAFSADVQFDHDLFAE